MFALYIFVRAVMSLLGTCISSIESLKRSCFRNGCRRWRVSLRCQASLSRGSHPWACQLSNLTTKHQGNWFAVQPSYPHTRIYDSRQMFSQSHSLYSHTNSNDLCFLNRSPELLNQLHYHDHSSCKHACKASRCWRRQIRWPSQTRANRKLHSRQISSTRSTPPT